MPTATIKEYEQAWKATLGELEVTLTKANYRTWFKKTTIVAVSHDEVVVRVPNTFAQEWLSKKYHTEILATLRQHYPNVRSVKYDVSATAGTPPLAQSSGLPVNAPGSENETTTPAPLQTEIDRQTTFDNFVVGSSNRFAHAAALAAAQHPGDRKSNPLYIYGGVGLGKTHLLQAIGNEIKRQSPTKTILYASCERFTSEFIEAIQSKKIDQFKKRYRNADVLLIDDIQFLSGKEGTQEEFFHTFNTLHQTNRQIVLTSDTRPQSIPELAPRLTSRFGWGMVADVQSPDYETRRAILRHKCEERHVPLSDDTVEYLATHVQSNIRDLEGILNRIIGHIELSGSPPSPSLIEQILAEVGADHRSRLTTDLIFHTVAEFFSLSLDDLLGKRRHKELVYPRQISMYLLRTELAYSYPKIGKALGGKDHTTIMHGVLKITKEMKRNEALQREITLLKERLYAAT